mgnify:CR=1 FL=1
MAGSLLSFFVLFISVLGFGEFDLFLRFLPVQRDNFSLFPYRLRYYFLLNSYM